MRISDIPYSNLLSDDQNNFCSVPAIDRHADMRNRSTSIVFKISQELVFLLRDRVKTPSERNVNDINIKPSPAIVAVESTDAHLIYEAAPPLLPRSLFPTLCIRK